MNVVIVGGFWFPKGCASAARIRNLALGLGECGAQVHVIAMAPQPRPRNAEGTLEPGGVTYEYAAPLEAAVDGWRDPERTVPKLRAGMFDKGRWFAGLYGATTYARRSLQRRIDEGRCDLALVYDRSALRMTPLVKLCRARRVPALLDVVEISEHLSAGRLNPIYWDFQAGARRTARLFDGLTVITSGLEAVYRKWGCARTLVVPAIEAWPPAEMVHFTDHAGFRLTYVGALQPRDAPGLLLEAMRLLVQQGVPVTLDVVGQYEGTRQGRAIREACGADPVLRPAVRFVGALSDRGLATHLAESDGLILPRRHAATEVLSFPTRLVEYLRQGRPVFVSDVGDVARYLEDGQDAVLLDPEDPARVAASIASVVTRPDRGRALGLRGHQAGARWFDRRFHAGRILEFAADLRSRRAS